MRTLALALLLLAPVALEAQEDPTYRDPVARQLVARARETRGELGSSITGYTAVIRKRFAAQLRMPLRDRLLARSESAARVRWSRDGETVVQLLAAREQDSSDADDIDPDDRIESDDVFDPRSERIRFGVGLDPESEEELWIVDPLAAGSDRYYRYASGDTMTVRLSGRSVRAVELRVTPVRPSFHYLSATLWVEPESGALVQAVYRPSRNVDLERDTVFIDAEDVDDLGKIPGFLRPIQIELDNIVVQYSLWDLRHWLPRLVRLEGLVRFGTVRLPVSQEMSYTIEDVTDETTTAAPALSAEEVVAGWAGGVAMERVQVHRWEQGEEGDSVKADTARDEAGERRRRMVVYAPKDRELLLESEELPPPIWEDAPEFGTEEELEALFESLDRSTPGLDLAPTLRTEWGLGGSDLLRYNRVEGLSVGARAIAEHPLGEARGTLRLGVADLHPNAELAVTYPSRRRTLEGSVYHQLASADARGRALGLGNSAGAFFLGRDQGEYYRATGARLSLGPARDARPSYRVSVFAERQREAERGTVWSAARLLGSGHDFRPNLDADAADLVGAALAWTPWWGHDPLRPGAGLDWLAEGAAGDYRFARARLTARALLPLGPTYRVGLETGAGTARGDLPAQYHWFLGGAETLRGYDPSTAVGSSFLRGRAELARGTPAGALALFSDAGWAGDRDAFDADDLLVSVGIGTSLLDGLLRLDLARALRGPRGWRLELHMDALM